MRVERSQRGRGWPYKGAVVTPSRAQISNGTLWPLPAQWIVRFTDPESSYAVDVEIGTVSGQAAGSGTEDSPEAELIVTGVAVRMAYATIPKPGGSKLIWESVDAPVSPREIKRLPLARYANAGLAMVANDLHEAERVLMPRGRPDRKGTQFYTEIANAHRALTAQRKRPAAEIAKRKKVEVNRVYQWIHTARKMGLLEPAQVQGGRRTQKADKRMRKGA